MTADSTDGSRTNEPSIPWSDVVRFTRQLSHDLRNNLNAMELQAAFIGEVVEDAEAKGEVKRLRAMASEFGVALQKVTAAMAPLNLHKIPYGASEYVEDLRQKLASEFPDESKTIDWTMKNASGTLEVDPQVLQQAFLELFSNAFRHERGEGNLAVEVNTDGKRFVFVLREPKAAAFDGVNAEWGAQPLKKVAHGHYGLGLYRARTILETHEGSLDTHYDSEKSALVTTATLPLSSAAD